MEAAPGLARGQRGLRVRCGAGADSLINLLKANVAGRRNNARSAPHRRGRYETRRGSGAQRNAAAAGARRARPPPGLPRTGRSPRPAAPRAVPLPAHHVLTPPVPLRPRTPRSPFKAPPPPPPCRLFKNAAPPHPPAPPPRGVAPLRRGWAGPGALTLGPRRRAAARLPAARSVMAARGGADGAGAGPGPGPERTAAAAAPGGPRRGGRGEARRRVRY